MAVYTPVSDRTLKDFMSGFELGAFVRATGIPQGVENTNYLLEMERGRFILTLFERRVNECDLPYFLGLMDHLSGEGIPCPAVIKNRHGQALHTLENRPACIVSFLSGKSLDFPSANQTAQAGGLLARMHKAARTYQGKRPNTLSLSGWYMLAEKSRDKTARTFPGLMEIIDAELNFLSKNWPQNLPSGPVHCDLFPDNTLFTGEVPTGVIDFYFAANDSFAYDLAVTLNSWCFSENCTFLPLHSKRLIEMYDTCRQLTGSELDALPILARGAALRFLLTRLYDWLHPAPGALVTPKDPQDYLKRLLFHQNVRDAADYTV